VLGQLGNRVQHALRAFTPRDQKAVRAAAETFRVNPELDVEAAITELGVGEALVSFLDEKGTPGIVERALIVPPRSMIGSITPEQRLSVVNWSPVQGKYDQLTDRESAYELLKAKADRAAAADAAAAEAEARAKEDAARQKELEKQLAAEEKRARSSRSSRKSEPDISDILSTSAQSAARSFGSQAGRSIVRGILGALTGKRR
jgi:hypothetical protein